MATPAEGAANPAHLSPVRVFALLTGIVFGLVALMGSLPATLLPPPADAPPLHMESGYGYIFGLFPVNVLHTAVHLLIAAWGLLASLSVSASRTFAKGLAILYGLLAVMGLIPALSTTFGWIPLFGHDVWLHALTAVIAAWFGFGSRR